MTNAVVGQAFVEVLAKGAPAAQVAQAFVEVLISAVPNADVAQAFAEIVLPTTSPPTPAPIIPPSLNRWRGNVGVNWNGVAIVGDAFSGVVGQSDFDTFMEYTNPMVMVVTAPPLQDDRKRIFVPRLEVQVQAGDGLPGSPSVGATMMLDYSKDGGMTWSTLQKWRSMGAAGQFAKRLRWLNLGHSREWVFRLTCSDPVRRAIIGAWVDFFKGNG